MTEWIGYLGTFLKDDKYEPKTGTCTLIIRRFTLKQKRNKPSIEVKTDAIDFPDEDAMVDWIEQNHAFELPSEAETNPHYVPPILRSA